MVERKENSFFLFVKFGQSERKMHANYILPRNPGDISFEETVLILKKYEEKISLFNTNIVVLKPDKK